MMAGTELVLALNSSGAISASKARQPRRRQHKPTRIVRPWRAENGYGLARSESGECVFLRLAGCHTQPEIGVWTNPNAMGRRGGQCSGLAVDGPKAVTPR